MWRLLDGHQDLTHADDCDCLMRGLVVVIGVSGLLALACVGRAHGHPHAVGRDPGGLMEAVLAVHNEVRGAANLPRLNWSDVLARRAAQWAAYLAARQLVAHSETNMAEGENIWVGTAGAFSYELMLRDWADEARFFRAGRFPHISTTGNWEDVGHYSQMIWRGSRHVGCAVATGDGWDYLVCRYDVQANLFGQMPY